MQAEIIQPDYRDVLFTWLKRLSVVTICGFLALSAGFGFYMQLVLRRLINRALLRQCCH
jgi:hypothetical protein